MKTDPLLFQKANPKTYSYWVGTYPVIWVKIEMFITWFIVFVAFFNIRKGL